MQYESTVANGTGSSPGQFKDLANILAMPGGIVYACDSGNNRIQKLADNGTVLAVWGNGTAGSGERELARCQGHRCQCDGNKCKAAEAETQPVIGDRVDVALTAYMCCNASSHSKGSAAACARPCRAK